MEFSTQKKQEEEYDKKVTATIEPTDQSLEEKINKNQRENISNFDTHREMLGNQTRRSERPSELSEKEADHMDKKQLDETPDMENFEMTEEED